MYGNGDGRLWFVISALAFGVLIALAYRGGA